MNEAEKVLQALTEEYNDYTYYPKLKDYYAAVKSYVEFYTSPSGSFKQLSDTINNYEMKLGLSNQMLVSCSTNKSESY